MKKGLIFEKRVKARKLYSQGWSIRKISKHLVSGKDNVTKWINLDESELKSDHRGWKKGKLRKRNELEWERIVQIRKELEDEESYFFGSRVIEKNYINRYHSEVPLWFVNHVLKEHKLAKSPVKVKGKKSRYMQYPEATLRKLGKIVMSADFIGPKYLSGSDKRINFLSCKYLRPSQSGIVKQVNGQTSNETLRVFKDVWQSYPIPDAIKFDNDSAFGAHLSHKGCIGKVSIALLNLGVIPIYVAPRSPWNNGSVEGFNSIFSKKFWNKLNFSDEEDLSLKIKQFNLEYEKYTDLVGNNIAVESPVYLTGQEEDKALDNKKVQKFKANKIIFLRIVRRTGEKGASNEEGFFDILGQQIIVPQSYINLFTFCELIISERKIKIYVEETDGALSLIKEKHFKIKNLDYGG